MPRCLVFLLSIALVALVPSVSLAAGEDCPDGWFCDPNSLPQPPVGPAPAPAPGPVPVAPGTSPSPAAAPGREPTAYSPPGSYPTPPPDPDGTPSANKPPAKRRQRGFREWGFNLHLEVALLGRESEYVSPHMGGLGFAFRYRPLPPLAFEAGVDFLKGTDSQGYSRKEASFLLNALLFFNPHDVAQIYALGGLSFSGAKVAIATRPNDEYFKRHDEDYSYFGGQLGLGVEVRVSRLIAVGGDLLGFIRGRTDDHAGDAPELIDGDAHHANDMIGGGLLRAGITFYW